jgi:hypothetical protein
MLEVLGSKPVTCKFLLFAFSFVHTNMNLYIQCMYLVYTSYEQALNKYVQKHVFNVHVCTMYVQCMYNVYTCLNIVHSSSSCLIP